MQISNVCGLLGIYAQLYPDWTCGAQTPNHGGTVQHPRGLNPWPRVQQPSNHCTLAPEGFEPLTKGSWATRQTNCTLWQCTCTCRSHIRCRRRSNNLALPAGSSAHDAVLVPLVRGGACTPLPFESGGGGGHVGWLCVGCVLVIFVLCSAKSHKQAKVRLMVNIWHIGYCRKALVIAKTISRLYQAISVGIKE